MVGPSRGRGNAPPAASGAARGGQGSLKSEGTEQKVQGCSENPAEKRAPQVTRRSLQAQAVRGSNVGPSDGSQDAQGAGRRR